MTTKLGKILTTADLAAVTQIHAAEFDDGAWLYVSSTAQYFFLQKASGAVPDGTTIIAPISGSPIAGNANARWILFQGSGGSPTGPASGDLAGSYPGPTVVGLRGQPINAAVAAPAAGDMLRFTGGSWNLIGADETNTPSTIPIRSAASAVNVTTIQNPAGALGVNSSTSVDFQIAGVTKASVRANILGIGDTDIILATNTFIGPTNNLVGGGFNVALTGGTVPAIGNRGSGGDLSLTGGDANGNAGGGTNGGEVSIKAGNGSSGGGSAGATIVAGGNGGAGGGGAGFVVIASGISGGGGAGQIEFRQGGDLGTLIGRFDDNNQFHIGTDADTTNTNLRINGFFNTTVGAAGGASAPPATPVGYVRISVNGTTYKFAAYTDAA